MMSLSRFAVVALILCHNLRFCDSAGDWQRAWPYIFTAPFEDYCFPYQTIRWGFNPQHLFGEKLTFLGDTFGQILKLSSNRRDAGIWDSIVFVLNAHQPSFVELIEEYVRETKHVKVRFLNYPKDGVLGEPISGIQLNLEWDDVTGEPSETKKVEDQYYDRHCQHNDNPAVPPALCLMLIQIISDINSSSNITQRTEQVLECEGLNAAMIVQGMSGAVPLTRHDRYPENTVFAKSNEDVFLLPNITGSYADLMSSNRSAIPDFCCTSNIAPIVDKNSRFTQQWELPALKVFLNGTFKLKVSNSDLLNTRIFEEAWAETEEAITVFQTSTPAPTRPGLEDLDIGMFGNVIQCPFDAQAGGEVKAEECSHWHVEDDGKKVSYQSTSPFNLGQQRAAVFHADTESIVLSSAGISTISSHLFANLQKLKRLDLSRNSLHDIPSFGLASAFIEELDLSYNHLETLNLYALRDIVQLTVLRANNNQLRHLEPNIFEMSVLEQLYLSHNLLTTLPEGLFTASPTSMLYLQTLDLSHNSLQTFGDANFFNYSANLRQLLLHGNPITDLSPFYTKLTPFQIVVEAREVTTDDEPSESIVQVNPRNKLTELTLDLMKIENLESDFFHGMRLKALSLWVSVTAASQLTYSLFHPLSATLTHLTLQIEDAYRVPVNCLSPLKALKMLRWTNSGLVSIKNRFVGLSNLQTLDLSRNTIYSLPSGVFDHLAKLTFLDLSENLIEYIHPRAFQYTTKLNTLLMNKNRLATLDKQVFLYLHDPFNNGVPATQRRRLHRLSLADNPIRCVGTWMEGPDTRWSKSISTYVQLYGPPPGYCTTCGVGYYAHTFDNEGSDCMPCPQGALCPEDDVFPWTLIWCDPGLYVEEGKGLTLDDCAPCPPGHFCPGEGQITPCKERNEVCEGGCVDACYVCAKGSVANGEHTRCTACARGTWSNDGNKCFPCKAGYYGHETGNYNEICNGLCEIGHYCPVGSSKATQMQCPSGTYGDTTGLSTPHCSGLCEIGNYCPLGSVSRYGIPCPAGRYGDKPGMENERCSGPCSPEHWCPIGSVSPINLKCPDGNISRAGDLQCYQCRPDFYSAFRTPLCSECPVLHTFDASVSISDSAVQQTCDDRCKPGTYRLLTNPGTKYEISICRECPPGTYNNKWGSTSEKECLACPTNTYSNQPGLSSKHLCKKCPNGKFSNVTGATSAKQCRPCPAGKYFRDNSETLISYDIDIVCEYCPTGTWTDGSDGICHLCSMGFWSNEKGRTRPCTQLCDEGYLCPIGSISPRMFALPQDENIPLLDSFFWVSTFICLVLTTIVILFRVAL